MTMVSLHAGGSALDATPALPAKAVRAPATGWRAWYELTKPKIVQMMLVTCLSAMVVADGGLPPLWTTLATLSGLALTIAGSSVLNHVFDADLDRRMARTAVRPVAAGTIGPGPATSFGVTLALLGGALLCLGVNNLTAWLALFGFAFYVFVYTPLKRVTVHNTVIGGIAGAVPPLVGWAAITGDLSSPLAWTLFAIMFTWQPAHFWPLSLLIREDYAKAGFKMLPVTHGERATVNATWRWTWIAVASTLVPLFTHDVGWVYVVGMVLANALLVRRMWSLVAADRLRGPDVDGAEPDTRLIAGPDSPGRIAARRAFLSSLTWLGILFVALIVDALVR
ncbi:MAG: protoheme IX farnesyltransferase [Thermoleophilia bacterium]|nr:protoheme IX farnesyltransferase [Thermoleophilia bacterium]